MPLYETQTPPNYDATFFLIYFAAGQPPWCEDCRKAFSAIRRSFGLKKNEPPTAYMVRVGTQELWQNPANKYRQEPHKLGKLPTIVKIDKKKETGRLVGADCADIEKIKRLVAG